MNIVRGELIGMNARVVTSTDPGLNGRSGLVVDETRNTLLVRTPEGERRVAKTTCTFELTPPGGEPTRIAGAKLHGRSEERIKRKVRQ